MYEGSIVRASMGRIIPSLRGITFAYSNNVLTIHYCYDSVISAAEEENEGDISAEVVGDLSVDDTMETKVISCPQPMPITMLDCWIFRRKEHEIGRWDIDNSVELNSGNDMITIDNNVAYFENVIGVYHDLLFRVKLETKCGIVCYLNNEMHIMPARPIITVTQKDDMISLAGNDLKHFNSLSSKELLAKAVADGYVDDEKELFVKYHSGYLSQALIGDITQNFLGVTTYLLSGNSTQVIWIFHENDLTNDDVDSVSSITTKLKANFPRKKLLVRFSRIGSPPKLNTSTTMLGTWAYLRSIYFDWEDEAIP